MNISAKAEPIFVMFWGLVVNLLIANGYLVPQQHDMWINGGLELISALGSVSLFTVYLHHALDKTKGKDIQKVADAVLKTINDQKQTSQTTPQSVHVNVP